MGGRSITDYPFVGGSTDAGYGRTLTFRGKDGQLIDEETGSTWDIRGGLALDSPLRGQSLQPILGSTAYDWAWYKNPCKSAQSAAKG